jgi:esterase/lipase
MLTCSSRLFTDPCLAYPIHDLNLSFSDYVLECQKLIAQTRMDIGSSQGSSIIHANSPFELHPPGNARPYGALLIHGLFDSPFIMKDIGLQLQRQNIPVKAILLPGHGTVPGALLHVDYREWLQAVRYGITSLRKEVEKLWLVGFSTGALLALYEAIRQPASIAGLILLAPPLKIRSLFSGIAGWHSWISRYWPRTAWLHQDSQETADYARYFSIPFNAVHQVNQLIKATQQAGTLRLPVMLVISENDMTVCSRASLAWFRQQSHPGNRLLVYSDVSHTAIPIAPDNLHYGQGQYQRVGFNPDFFSLMQSMQNFIDSLM